MILVGAGVGKSGKNAIIRRRGKMSLVEQKTRFKEITGFRATARITERGARNSATIVVGLEERLKLGKTHRVDVFSAGISASQLLNWWDQKNKQVSSGDRSDVKDLPLLSKIKVNSQKKGKSSEYKKRLTILKYVADPEKGATKAMSIFEELNEIYPVASLDDGDFLPQEAGV